MALPKRPRVFFSEEQKERLRQAYNRDPYPNQNTIEALASSLGVGVKTVINWFHNHRMRAKQQQHASSPTTPFSEYSQSGLSKDESNDDNSNNSDISSMSDNKEGMGSLSFHSRFINADANQWMFPKFVPVNSGSKQGNLGSEDNNDSEKGDVLDDDAMEDSTDAKDDSINAKDSDCDEEKDGDFDEQSDDSSYEKNEKESDLSKGQITSITQSGSNRRKRSHPQYVSAGRHLDRTVHRLDNNKSDAENNNDVDLEKENTIDNIDDIKNENDTDIDHGESRKGLNGSGTEEKKNGSNIDKIQKAISQHSGETWEF